MVADRLQQPSPDAAPPVIGVDGELVEVDVTVHPPIMAKPTGGVPATRTCDGSSVSSIIVVPGGKVMPTAANIPSAAVSTAASPTSSLASAQRTPAGSGRRSPVTEPEDTGDACPLAG